ncbi:MAG: hypothetical protein JWQ42_3934 [Edaphobacter sp.]|nr:hypothetical protein [Edaphobacter sp.]
MRLLILAARKSSAGCHPTRDYHACMSDHALGISLADLDWYKGS